MNNKIMTLCLAYDDKRILLGMKKRGFGAGNWNGFGGKVGKEETIEQAARREVAEEAGIVIKKINKRGMIVFAFENEPEKMEVHIFSSNAFKGEPVETEEMRPEWFALDEIPYKNMWPDDIFWLPMMLAGKNFEGKFLFDSRGTEIIRYELKEIK